MAVLALCGVLACVAVDAAEQQSLTLEEALALAERNSPQVAFARSQLPPAQADVAEARTLLAHNPELTVEGRHRVLAQPEAPGMRRQDAGVGISQTFETGGQPRARRAAAQASVEAAEAALRQARGEVRLEAGRRFIEALQLQQRLESDLQSASLAKQAASIVDQRVRAGEDTRLDGNLALVEAERAQAQAAQTSADVAQARAQLATALQLPPGTLPQPADLIVPRPTGRELGQLLAAAEHHPRLQALAAKANAARHRLELERTARSPDVTLGLNQSRERGLEGTDRITTLSISLPLPLFRNNGAAIARAQAEQDQAQAELQAAQRDTEASVRALSMRAQQLLERLRRLEEGMLPALRDNERLSLASLRAGEINVSQFLLVRRQTLEAQRDVLEARAQAALAQLELEAAAGWDIYTAATSP